MASIQANGITIEYEQVGEPDGEPVLLVMGLGGQLVDWPPEFVEQLAAAGFHVTIYDNRDIGLSTEFDWEPPSQMKTVIKSIGKRPIEAEYTIIDMARDAAELLDALDIESSHVVGMSMGGMIAQQLTIDRPERVRSLTSIMSHPGDGKSGRIAGKVMAKMARRPAPTPETAPDMSVQLFQMISGPHLDVEVHRERAVESVARSFRPAGVARQTAAIMASPDRTPGLSSVSVPTLVIHGLVDTLVKPSGGVATANAVPHSRLLMFPDMGHDLPRPRWAEIVGEIRENANRAAPVTV